MHATRQTLIPEEPRIPWLEWLDTLFRRRRIILLTLLGGFLLASLAAWSMPAVYEAKARIQLTAQALSGPRVQAMSDREILAELAMLKSPGLLRTMLDDESVVASNEHRSGWSLNSLRDMGWALLKAVSRVVDGTVSTAPVDRLIQDWAGNIRIDRVGDSNVVEVAFTDRNSEQAAHFVNNLLVHHIERIASLGEGTGARSFYEKQADLLAERWRAATEALLAFRRKHGADVSEGEIQRTISTLESQRVATETQALELEATIDFITTQLVEVPETVEGELLEKRDESVGLLKGRLLELKIKRIELLSTYTPDSTVVRDIDRQVLELQELLASNQDQFVAETLTEPNPSHQTLEVQLLQSKSKLNAARARLLALGTQISTYRKRLGSIEEIVAELTRLQSSVDNAREDHKTYLRQTERARLESALDASGSVNVTIIERAEAPLSPLPSGKPLLLLAGAIAALLLGVALAFVVDLLDPTLKSGLQVERLTGLPVIAEITLDREAA